MSREEQHEQLVADHSVERIQTRLSKKHKPSYISDFIYGAIDGTVTTFAVVSGVAGADLSSSIVIILGVSNLVGDGFSMAASNYLGTRVDVQLYQKARAMENHHIDTYPEGEREEIRQIFKNKGFEGEDLDRAVTIITDSRQRWIDTMLTDEHGLSLSVRSPLAAATATMIAFVVVGLIPLASFIFQAISPDEVENAFQWSCALTGLAFLTVGAIKSRFVEQKWYWSSAETLAVGGAAAVLAYVVAAGIAALV